MQPQWTNRLGIFLSSAVLGATLCSSTVALAATIVEAQSIHLMPGPSRVRQEALVVQYVVDNKFTEWFRVMVSAQKQRSVGLIPINWQARTEQEDSEEQPTPSPRSDLPAPPDPEPEPYANMPDSAVPPSDVPLQPGLTPPPMPKPSAPHLAPPPLPMPEPAKPPPLSQRPDLNPAHPGTPEPPSIPPSSQPEPAAPEPTGVKSF